MIGTEHARLAGRHREHDVGLLRHDVDGRVVLHLRVGVAAVGERAADGAGSLVEDLLLEERALPERTRRRALRDVGEGLREPLEPVDVDAPDPDRLAFLDDDSSMRTCSSSMTCTRPARACAS